MDTLDVIIEKAKVKSETRFTKYTNELVYRFNKSRFKRDWNKFLENELTKIPDRDDMEEYYSVTDISRLKSNLKQLYTFIEPPYYELFLPDGVKDTRHTKDEKFIIVLSYLFERQMKIDYLNDALQAAGEPGNANVIQKSKGRKTEEDRPFEEYFREEHRTKLPRICKEVFGSKSPKVHAMMLCILTDSKDNFIYLIDGERASFYKSWYTFAGLQRPKNDNFYAIDKHVEYSVSGFMFIGSAIIEYENKKESFYKALKD